MGCCPWLLPLAPAEQSIQLFICHTSRLRLCYRLTTRQFLQWKIIYIHFSGNQSKSQETVWANWNCLSLFTSHFVSTSRAEHTTSQRGRATTSFISYHQLKTWSLLSKTINLNLGRRWGKTEIVCHWSLLMLLEIAEQSIQLLTCHISKWRLCHCSPQDN